MKETVLIRVFTIPCFLFALSSCSLGKSEPASKQNAQIDVQIHSDTLTNENSGDNSVFGILNSKCREAIKDAQDFDNWKKSDDKGAKTACSMFDKYLSDNKLSYDKLRFITEPAGSYYFMEAFIEREITVIRAIDTEHGVIEHKTEGAIDKFAKDIHILDTTDTARRLAKMFHCFHVGSAMSLVTEHHEKSWRAEQNAPEMKKNEDGSLTLVYDLINTGRSASVKQCTLNISSNYEVTLACKEKES